MSTYNGWTNYETWRINLEFFDAYTAHDMAGETTDEIAEELREIVDSYIDENTSSTLVYGWAASFLNEVNYDEIAQAILEA